MNQNESKASHQQQRNSWSEPPLLLCMIVPVQHNSIVINWKISLIFESPARLMYKIQNGTWILCNFHHSQARAALRWYSKLQMNSTEWTRQAASSHCFTATNFRADSECFPHFSLLLLRWMAKSLSKAPRLRRTVNNSWAMRRNLASWYEKACCFPIVNRNIITLWVVKDPPVLLVARSMLKKGSKSSFLSSRLNHVRIHHCRCQCCHSNEIWKEEKNPCTENYHNFLHALQLLCVLSMKKV